MVGAGANDRPAAGAPQPRAAMSMPELQPLLGTVGGPPVVGAVMPQALVDPAKAATAKKTGARLAHPWLRGACGIVRRIHHWRSSRGNLRYHRIGDGCYRGNYWPGWQRHAGPGYLNLKPTSECVKSPGLERFASASYSAPCGSCFSQQYPTHAMRHD